MVVEVLEAIEVIEVLTVVEAMTAVGALILMALDSVGHSLADWQGDYLDQFCSQVTDTDTVVIPNMVGIRSIIHMDTHNTAILHMAITDLIKLKNS